MKYLDPGLKHFSAILTLSTWAVGQTVWS